MKKCLYCGREIQDDRVVDFCDRCGINAFGKKMFEAILKNMEEAKETGNLNLGAENSPRSENTGNISEKY